MEKNKEIDKIRKDDEIAEFFASEYANQQTEESSEQISPLTMKDIRKDFLAGWNKCKEYYMMKAKEKEINKKIEEYTTQGDCPHYDENSSVCDDGECGCPECISRIIKCEKNSIEPDKN